MNIFLKVTAGILTALILWLCLNKYSKDMSVLLTLAVCAIAFAAAITFLEPLVRFFHQLQDTGNLDEELLSVVLKSVGISLLGEICMLVCKDAGNESMGKVLQTLTTTVVLWLSLPVFEKLLSLLDKILGTV